MGRIADIGEEITEVKQMHYVLTGGDLTGLASQLRVLEREREVLARFARNRKPL